MRLYLALAISLILAGPAAAQEPRPSHCISLVRNVPGLEVLQPASLADPLAEYTVQIGYVDHSMFVLRTRAGHTAVTDYAGYHGTSTFVPDVVTMNKGHSSHWTAHPNPAIPHVLRGWTDDWAPPPIITSISATCWCAASLPTSAVGRARRKRKRHLRLRGRGSVHRSSGPPASRTDPRAIRRHRSSRRGDGGGGWRADAGSPVDGAGAETVPLVGGDPDALVRRSTLEAFLADMSSDFVVDRRGESFMQVSLHTLPSQPTVVVLEPRLIQEPDH